MNIFLVAAVVVGTWSGNWFPSGRAEHRAHPDIEASTISAAAKMLASGLKAVDPEGTNDVIICMSEIRGPKVASNLVAQIGRAGLKVVSVSGYRRRDRFDQQQNVIATTLPVVESSWRKWSYRGKKTPPRGYAFASLLVDNVVTAGVYAVHLKSNYGGRSREAAALNREKRTIAVEQLLEDELTRQTSSKRASIVAGDMNADCWSKEFADEMLFKLFAKGGYTNLLGLLPPGSRGTHPSKKWGDSALDYIFSKGFDSVRQGHIESAIGISDHNAFFAVVELKK
ncbi:MAG: endonuclease/exonuclease/phosphatase family protein [Kiritimatiellae bacterium]|nr:endonuclease/exonuclease/phosphatase family protein [Kiritimatiellia bacterium]